MMERSRNIEKLLLSCRRLQKQDFELHVPREDLFKACIHFLKDETSHYKNTKVAFSTDGVDDRGIDIGAMKLEMFTLFFEECLAPGRRMFEGKGRTRVCSNNQTAIQERWFYCLGKAIVLSLTSGGPTFPYLTNVCYQCITSDDDGNLSISFSDLPDGTKMTKLLKKMWNSKSKHEFDSIIESSDFKSELKDIDFPEQDICGEILYSREEPVTDKSSKNIISTSLFQNKQKLIDDIIHWYCIGMRRSALEQLKDGLNSLAFLTRARALPDSNQELKNILVYHPDHGFSLEYLTQILLPKLTDMRTEDDHEHHIKALASHCLLSLEEEQATDLFQCITGMRDSPLREPNIKIAINRQNPKEKFPRFLVCSQLMLVPLGNRTDKEFVQSFATALSDGRIGFGRL